MTFDDANSTVRKPLYDILLILTGCFIYWLAYRHLLWGLEKSWGLPEANTIPTILTGLFGSIVAGFYVGTFKPQKAVLFGAIIPIAFILFWLIFIILLFLNALSFPLWHRYTYLQAQMNTLMTFERLT